jgi:hypothetical protein
MNKTGQQRKSDGDALPKTTPHSLLAHLAVDGKLGGLRSPLSHAALSKESLRLFTPWRGNLKPRYDVGSSSSSHQPFLLKDRRKCV